MLFYQLTNGTMIAVDQASQAPTGAVAIQESDFVTAASTLVVAGPLSCTPYQFKAALVQQNLYTQALSAVNAAPLTTQLAWSEALSFVETDALVISMATALGQTTDQIHTLFQLAQTIIL